jgi:hypothetical protein
MESGRCELCGRQVDGLQQHHLIPRTRHRNRRNKKSFDRREVRERIALLCPPCHDTVHTTFTTKELEYDYNTLAAIRDHPAIRAFVRWVRKHPNTARVRVRRKGGDDLLRQEVRRQQKAARQCRATAEGSRP